VLDSAETEWDVTNVDPQYHFDAIVAAMKKTIANAEAKGFGKIQAVGGSATGTVSGDNEATWCDIFPNVPPDVYKAKVVDIFKRIAKEVAGDVPLKVINDGEVTALAAVQKVNAGNVLGISMGSSEGGGYANADGNLMGWINELCYIRLDLNPDAPTDPWTKGSHRGISHMYLGQRGATKLAAKAGVKVPENYVYPHPDMCTIKHEDHAQCLKLIQKAMADKEQEPKVRKLYETVGVYLGYGLAQYVEFYKIDHVMILGRVSKGAGGDLMLATAQKVLETEFPDLPKITFHTAEVQDDEECFTLLKHMRDLNIRRLGHCIFPPQAFIDAIHAGGIHEDGGKIGIEICPTSNMVTGEMTQGLRDEHHFPLWWKKGNGALISINTDDTGLFLCDLSTELHDIAEAFDLTWDDLVDIQRMALESSFHPQKDKLLARFEQQLAEVSSKRRRLF